MQQLIPWPFLVVDEVPPRNSFQADGLEKNRKFKNFFYHLRDHRDQLRSLGLSLELNHRDEVSTVATGKVSVTLPKKSWRVPAGRNDSMVINPQGPMLNYLLRDVHENIADFEDRDDESSLV